MATTLPTPRFLQQQKLSPVSTYYQCSCSRFSYPSQLYFCTSCSSLRCSHVSCTTEVIETCVCPRCLRAHPSAENPYVKAGLQTGKLSNTNRKDVASNTAAAAALKCMHCGYTEYKGGAVEEEEEKEDQNKGRRLKKEKEGEKEVGGGTSNPTASIPPSSSTHQEHHHPHPHHPPTSPLCPLSPMEAVANALRCSELFNKYLLPTTTTTDSSSLPSSSSSSLSTHSKRATKSLKTVLDKDLGCVSSIIITPQWGYGADLVVVKGVSSSSSAKDITPPLLLSSSSSPTSPSRINNDGVYTPTDAGYTHQVLLAELALFSQDENASGALKNTNNSNRNDNKFGTAVSLTSGTSPLPSPSFAPFISICQRRCVTCITTKSDTPGVLVSASTTPFLGLSTGSNTGINSSSGNYNINNTWKPSVMYRKHAGISTLFPHIELLLQQQQQQQNQLHQQIKTQQQHIVTKFSEAEQRTDTKESRGNEEEEAEEEVIIQLTNPCEYPVVVELLSCDVDDDHHLLSNRKDTSSGTILSLLPRGGSRSSELARNKDNNNKPHEKHAASLGAFLLKGCDLAELEDDDDDDNENDDTSTSVSNDDANLHWLLQAEQSIRRSSSSSTTKSSSGTVTTTTSSGDHVGSLDPMQVEDLKRSIAESSNSIIPKEELLGNKLHGGRNSVMIRARLTSSSSSSSSSSSTLLPSSPDKNVVSIKIRVYLHPAALLARGGGVSSSSSSANTTISNSADNIHVIQVQFMH